MHLLLTYLLLIEMAWYTCVLLVRLYWLTASRIGRQRSWGAAAATSLMIVSSR
jgi:hypothetical protein